MVVVVGSLLLGLNPLQVLSLLTGGGGRPPTSKPVHHSMTERPVLCGRSWATRRTPGRRFFSSSVARPIKSPN